MTEPSLFVLPHADHPARWLLCTLCRWCWNDILCWQPDPESAVSGTKQPDLMWVCSRSSLCSVCSWKNGWNRRNPPDFTQLGESFSPLSTFVSLERPLVVSSSRPLVVSLLTAVPYHYILFFSKVYLAMMPCKHTPSLTIFAHCSHVILDVDFFFFFFYNSFYWFYWKLFQCHTPIFTLLIISSHLLVDWGFLETGLRKKNLHPHERQNKLTHINKLQAAASVSFPSLSSEIQN